MDVKLLLSVVFLSYCCAGENLCLYREGKNACTECSRQYTDNFSQDDLPNGNYTLQFCSKYFSLTSILNITGSFSVTVKGLPSVVECVGPDVGLLVSSVNQLMLRDITFLSCGSEHFIHYSGWNTVSAIIVANCTDVTIERLNVTGSTGTGLSMLNNSGSVLIQDTTFERSGHEYSNFSSGLYVEISSKTLSCNHCILNETMEQNYTISNCTFSENVNNVSYGGGMFIMFMNNSTNNQITIVDSNFSKNVAARGGGLFAILQRNATNNSLVIKNSSFSKNKANDKGGGINTGYDLHPGHSANNTIFLTDCFFCENEAESGGGVSYFSSPSPTTVIQIIFEGCNWTGNVAHFGAAVDMTPWYGSKFILYNITDSILFQDCIFQSNRIEFKDPLSLSYVRGKGTFTSVSYHINFKGKIVFDSNNDSAMYLSSSRLDFLANTTTEFVDNQGFEGGAIYLLGYSILVLHENIQLTFKDNVAEKKGGAIFHKTYISFSRGCFFSYVGDKENSSSAAVVFQNNSIDGNVSSSSGYSIYATTLLPCKRLCKTQSNIPAEIFKCIGRFMIENSSSFPQLSTDGKESNRSAKTLNVVPGSRVKIPVTTRDDLSQKLEPVYHIQVQKSKNNSITIFDKTLQSGYVVTKSVVVFGEPDDTALLEVATTTVREVVIYINILMLDCPPGFVLEERKCICLYQQYKHFYAVIESCIEENMTATLAFGYWIGYKNPANRSLGIHKNLQYSHCPHNQCFPPNKDNTSLSLPKNNSVAALTRYVCGETREGVLCSKCKDGYILHFHDNTNTCKRSNYNLCYLGWFFYILSEIVPVTVFFGIIMLFDFKLMDGAVNGFILFAQLSSSNIHKFFRGTSYHFLKVYQLLAGIWNLEFFSFDHLSFCLWKSATMMDMLAFRYVTIFYSLLLVFLIIICFQYCHKKKSCILLGRVTSTKTVIIHGIAGFLILCYSDCVNVSLQLLNSTKIQGLIENHLVPSYDGDSSYFADKHLYYALPALLIVLVFGLIPPLILISYPLCYRLFSLFKVGESRFVSLLCFVIPLEKFKPFFDSFQFCFKDNCRYFSGLYFLYRLAFLMIKAFADRRKFLYVYLQIQLTMMLTIHAICQPYKKRWHNVLDSVLIMDLNVVNTITLVNLYHTVNLADSCYYLHIASIFQLILLYLPLIYITVYLIKSMLKKVWLWKFKVVEPSDYYEMTESLSLDAAEERLRN